MRRMLLVLSVATVVLIAGVVYLASRGSGPDLVPPLSRSCEVRTESGLVKLDPDQMANAATIAAVGIRRGLPERAILVALATALQESELINVPYGDRDSVGLFQQRPSQGWGKVEELLDPRYAANAFYNKLERTPGWEEMRVTQAAQAVQVSAYPEAYDKWVDESTVLTEALAGHAAGAVSCSHFGEPAQRGPAAAQALGDGIRLDWGDVATSPAADAPSMLSLDATGDPRTGWQYAHWLVAHSDLRGVQRVRYADREWSAERGHWSQVSDTPATSVVLAEVYPA